MKKILPVCASIFGYLLLRRFEYRVLFRIGNIHANGVHVLVCSFSLFGKPLGLYLIFFPAQQAPSKKERALHRRTPSTLTLPHTASHRHPSHLVPLLRAYPFATVKMHSSFTLATALLCGFASAQGDAQVRQEISLVSATVQDLTTCECSNVVESV